MLIGDAFNTGHHGAASLDGYATAYILTITKVVALGCRLPERCMQLALFEQSIDHSRPHVLMTVNTKHAGSLEYRYGDAGEVVSVPNIWYNQTCQVRAAALRWEAFRLCARGSIRAKPVLYRIRSGSRQSGHPHAAFCNTSERRCRWS